MKNFIFKLGDRLTLFGEKHNIRFLVYNPITWLRFLISGRRNGPIFAKEIRKLFADCDKVIDVGAGSGSYLWAFKKAGLQVGGYEYSPVGRFFGRLQGVSVNEFDCAKDRDLDFGAADLVYTIEVAEHLPAELADGFIEVISAAPNYLLFSAAHPGQGGQGHINEQPKDYWREKIVASGFVYLESMTEQLSQALVQSGFRGWLPQNVMIFKRQNSN